MQGAAYIPALAVPKPQGHGHLHRSNLKYLHANHACAAPRRCFFFFSTVYKLYDLARLSSSIDITRPCLSGACGYCALVRRVAAPPYSLAPHSRKISRSIGGFCGPARGAPVQQSSDLASPWHEGSRAPQASPHVYLVAFGGGLEEGLISLFREIAVLLLHGVRIAEPPEPRRAGARLPEGRAARAQ